MNIQPSQNQQLGFPHDIKGNALYGFVILKETGEYRNRENLSKEINQQISKPNRSDR
jgi:acyl-coenzyme A synthetase/AMP-(fatty) acid ligase